MTMVCDRCNVTYDVMDDVILDGERRSMYYSIKAEEIDEDTTVVEDTTIAEVTTAVEEDRYESLGCCSVNCNADGEPVYRCEAEYEALNMDAITLDKCYEFCSANLADFFSISMTDCFCDMSYYGFGTCSTPCAGNPAQTCGGPESVSFYRIK